uniref:Uncharacterized protein n=1 Tax=Rhizophora mucronata TaxID=61149 RepID=A0A2P2PY60_RHIMU
MAVSLNDRRHHLPETWSGFCIEFQILKDQNFI